jgi:serine/threonine protein kinase
MEEKHVRHIVFQLLQALNFMHDKDIMHRDLKPDNILCQEPAKDSGLIPIKLTDFGFSKQTEEDESFNCGTPIYKAPELYSFKRNRTRV